jgi:tetratricopeptide (TPR) repeat protein
MLKRYICSLLLLCAAGVACAAEAGRPAGEVELAQTSERIQKLESELAVAQHKMQISLDASNKRLDDTAAQLATQATMQGTHTTWVGNIVAMFSVGITLIVALAGVVTYFNATARAEREANRAAEIWFDNKGKQLTDRIEALRTEIDSQMATITGLTQAAKDKISKEMEAYDQAKASAETIMRGQPDPTKANAAAAEAVQQAVTHLDDAKPRNTFNAEENYLLGVTQFYKQDWQAALESFETAIRLGASAPLSDRIKYLNARGVALDAMGKHNETIDIYDAIEAAHGKDATSAVRQQLAKALVNKAIILHRQGKKDEATDLCDTIKDRFGDDDTPDIRAEVARALVCKANFLGPDKEIEIYSQVDERYRMDQAPGVREQVAQALFAMGFRLNAQNKPTEALATYDQLDVRYGGMEEAPDVREHAASALVNKGLVLQKMGRSDEATDAYTKMIQRYEKDDAPAVREQVEKARRLLALRRIRRNDPDDEVPV